jgi:hypothetical protein
MYLRSNAMCAAVVYRVCVVGCGSSEQQKNKYGDSGRLGDVNGSSVPSTKTQGWIAGSGMGCQVVPSAM